MAVEFKICSTNWLKSETPESYFVDFGKRIENANVCLQSYEIKYSGNKDHHVLGEGAKIYNVQFDKATGRVNFTAEIKLEDDTGSNGIGQLVALVIADVYE